MSRHPRPHIAVERLETRQLLAAAVSHTEVLAGFAGKNGINTVAEYLRANPKADLWKYVSLKHSRPLFRDGKTSTVQLRLTTGSNPAGAIKLLKKIPAARWVSPNFYYGNDGAEFTPIDPQYAGQANALAKLNLPSAWDVTKGSGSLVVAVLDDGFDFTQEDLQGVVWTNPGEIAGNGIDDDKNGLVDDTRGYDFGNGDNDPSPVFDTTYGFTESHGTQVASLIGANMNDKGVAGVAAGVKLMPVRFRGANVNVSSAGIAQSVAYAANMGAKIINLSYSFDPYMNDPAFTASVDLAYSRGVLWINSSGNQGVANPPRTTLDKILFVNNVDATDTNYVDSNYGTATDLSAPGVDVPAAAPGNQYYPVTGTSFSSAVTTGVAALIWSKNPTWTRDQVAAQLLGTTDNIDAQNPNYVGLLGVGRVNAQKAVTNTLAAPTLKGLVGIASGASVSSPPLTISVATVSVLNPATVTAAAFELRGAGADNKFDTADDVIVPLAVATPYAYGSNKIDLAVGSTLAVGNYRFTAKNTLANPFGTTLVAPQVTAFGVIAAPPAPPTNFAVVTPSYSQTEAELTWTDRSDNETGFTIERSTSSTFATIEKTYTAVANSNRYNDWGLEQGKTYYYRVRAYNAVGQGANSATATLAIPAPPPGVPTAPSALTGTVVSGSPTEAALKWTDNSNNETGFTMQRSLSGTFATIDKTFTAVPGSNTYYDWGLNPGSTYYYRIAAVNGADTSPWSNTLTFTTTGGGTNPTNPTTPTTPTTPTAPTAPTGLGVTAATGGKATVKWTDTSTNETSFVLERSILSSFALLTTSKTLLANSTTLADTGLTAGWTYYYRIKAVNSVGASAWSTVVSVRAT